MSLFSRLQPIPSHVHAKLILVRQNPGIHIEFPFGYPKFPKSENRDFLLYPTYTGYTLRVFFYATDATSHTRVDIFSSTKWYAGSQVHNGQSFSYYNNNTSEGKKEYGTAVPAGAYYSMGCRYRHDKYLRGVFDDKEGPETEMWTKLEGQKYYMNIDAAKHVVLSIHVSDELHQHFPENGLGNNVRYPNMEAASGSTYTAICVFTGSSRNVKVKLYQDGTQPAAIFTNVPLKKNDLFTVYIRNLPEHWLLHTSFSPTPQVLKAYQYREFIDPILEEGGYVKRATYIVMLH